MVNYGSISRMRRAFVFGMNKLVVYYVENEVSIEN
jgi:hypothetical protein